jgi:hypothetical protein
MEAAIKDFKEFADAKRLECGFDDQDIEKLTSAMREFFNVCKNKGKIIDDPLVQALYVNHQLYVIRESKASGAWHQERLDAAKQEIEKLISEGADHQKKQDAAKQEFEKLRGEGSVRQRTQDAAKQKFEKLRAEGADHQERQDDTEQKIARLIDNGAYEQKRQDAAKQEIEKLIGKEECLSLIKRSEMTFSKISEQKFESNSTGLEKLFTKIDKTHKEESEKLKKAEHKEVDQSELAKGSDFLSKIKDQALDKFPEKLTNTDQAIPVPVNSKNIQESISSELVSLNHREEIQL